MAALPHANKLAAYSSAAAHGGVAAADPHKLIVLLLDGALERIAMARGCIQRDAAIDKAQYVNRAVNIISELRGSLDMNAGGDIARNLSDLYEYMCVRLLKGSLDNQPSYLDEVSALLRQIREAWVAIPVGARVK
jgi:flagellar protein FliS